MELTVNEDMEIVFGEVFNPIVVKTTDDGEYGICQRDGGIIIMKDGEAVFMSLYACPQHPNKRMNVLDAKAQEFKCKECNADLKLYTLI